MNINHAIKAKTKIVDIVMLGSALMPRPCWQWFKDLEESFQREKISKEEFEKETEKLRFKGGRKPISELSKNYVRRILAFFKKYGEKLLKEARGHK